MQDCNGDFGGTAFFDNCGDCVGGNTGDVACVLDCNGDFGGTAFLDNCGDCVGGNTGDAPCVADCNGDFGGTAFFDNCGDCVGGNTGEVPCVVPCTNVTLEINSDLSGTETTWDITLVGAGSPSCSGGPYVNGFQINATHNCCLPEGCYVLRVFDSAGDGMINGFNGGYQLRLTADARRIIDNKQNGGFGSISQVTGNAYSFCIPVGNDELIYTSCDKYWWKTAEYIVAVENLGVSAVWVPNGANSVQSATTGYEFWFYNPNGGYSFRKFRSHKITDGMGNIGATRTCHLKLNNWVVANHIPEGQLMNVRIRSRVQGTNSPWGPACRFIRDEVLAQCPPTKLMDIPGNQYLSCGQFRQFVAGQRVYARPIGGATQYEWRFRIPAENVEIRRTTNTYLLNFGWNAGIAAPLVGGQTYEVDVRAFRNGSWCVDPLDADSAWGDICLLTILNTPMQGGNQNLAHTADRGMELWPNPNNGDQFRIALTNIPEEVMSITMDIHDLQGKRQVARQFSVTDGSLDQLIQLNGQLASGVYLVTIMAGEERYSHRMVITN